MYYQMLSGRKPYNFGAPTVLYIKPNNPLFCEKKTLFHLFSPHLGTSHLKLPSISMNDREELNSMS